MFNCVRIITEAERIQLCERIAEKISADYGCEKAPVLEWLVTSGYGRGKNVISAFFAVFGSGSYGFDCFKYTWT